MLLSLLVSSRADEIHCGWVLHTTNASHAAQGISPQPCGDLVAMAASSSGDAFVPSDNPAPPKPDVLMEMPQNAMYGIMQKGEAFFVEHKITKELKELPAGGRWLLRSKGDRVFALSENGATNRF